MRTIALLRGVNVGGARKLPMADWRALMSDELGYANVATYVQSGNAVFDTPEQPLEQVRADLEQAIEARFGFDVLVTLRTREQLAAVVEANPLGASAEEGKFFHVVFLADAPERDAVAALIPEDPAPERWELIGRELYLATPGGIGRSRLAEKLNDRRMRVAATARNWRTVDALLRLADAAPSAS